MKIQASILAAMVLSATLGAGTGCKSAKQQTANKQYHPPTRQASHAADCLACGRG